MFLTTPRPAYVHVDVRMHLQMHVRVQARVFVSVAVVAHVFAHGVRMLVQVHLRRVCVRVNVHVYVCPSSVLASVGRVLAGKHVDGKNTQTHVQIRRFSAKPQAYPAEISPR